MDASATFQMQRFWCPPQGAIRLGHDGYLIDPESDWGSQLQPDVLPVDLLLETPCLVLLGEPGSGKSTTLQAERQSIQARLTEANQGAIWLDLHEVGTDAQLWRRLFDTPEFDSWKHGDRVLNLFLDSLDECRVQINTLPALLLDEFRRCPIERLRVRIACRTADWPSALERGLRDLWGRDAVHVYELAPLRRIDVQRASDATGVDSNAFLEAVTHAEAVPLAIKPLTLNFLLRTFLHRGALPERRAELYGEGCRLLCEESEGRRELRLPRLLEAKQRLAVSERIAAITVFANAAAVSMSMDRGDALDDDVRLQALSGGMEAVDCNPFLVSEQGIEETLNTGLFSSRGEGRLGWAHRTYEEFLAALYLVDHNVPLPQIMSLIVHPGDQDGKLVPQLHETAAWLAAMRPDIFHAILRRDTEVLLRSDVSGATDEDRSALVSALLLDSDTGTWVDRDWGLRRHYARLNHPGLAAQLRSYIIDPSKGSVVRRVAIHIAKECQERGVLADLVAVALDADTPEETRVAAAYAVIDIGDEDSRRQLKALVATSPHLDPNDELKGCGLLATWPGLLPTQDLFDAITPHRGNLVGSYSMFLSRNPIEHVPIDELPIALRWAEQHADAVTVPYDLEQLINDVMVGAWNHLDVPDVLEGFSRVTWTKARHSDPIFQDDALQLLADVDRRRQALAGAIVAASDDSDVRLLTWRGLVQTDDAHWVLEQYQSRQDPEKGRWLELLRSILRYEDMNTVDAVLTACELDARLKGVMAPLFDPIPFPSEEADRQRRLYRMANGLDEDAQDKRPLPDPSPADRIARLLGEFEAGDLTAWWQLNLVLTLDQYGTQIDDEFGSDLTALPGWQSASSETRAAATAAAERYLREARPNPEQWIEWNGPITIYRPDWAGFRAFRLLLANAPVALASLPTEVWVRWAPVLVAFPMFDNSGGDGWYQDLIYRAYRQAPDEVFATLRTRIQTENEGEHPSVDRLLRMMDRCWDERLADAIVELVKDVGFASVITGQCLEALFGHSVKETVPLALSMVPAPLPTEEQLRGRAVVAAALLLNHAADAGWPMLWPLMQEEPEFAESVLARLVWDERRTPAAAIRLTDPAVADLYIWLCRRYPPKEDPDINGIVEYRAAVGQWRDGLLTHLRLQGTEREPKRPARPLPRLWRHSRSKNG